jgi:hypothetical protein
LIGESESCSELLSLWGLRGIEEIWAGFTVERGAHFCVITFALAAGNHRHRDGAGKLRVSTLRLAHDFPLPVGHRHPQPQWRLLS